MTINERVFKLLENKNKSQKELAAYIGTTPQVINKWKTRGTNPPSEYIYKIAEYFDTSAEYILTGQTEKLHLNQEEKLLVKYYRNMSAEQKKGIMVTAETMYNAHPTGLSSDSKIG